MIKPDEVGALNDRDLWNLPTKIRIALEHDEITLDEAKALTQAVLREEVTRRQDHHG